MLTDKVVYKIYGLFGFLLSALPTTQLILGAIILSTTCIIFLKVLAQTDKGIISMAMAKQALSLSGISINVIAFK